MKSQKYLCITFLFLFIIKSNVFPQTIIHTEYPSKVDNGSFLDSLVSIKDDSLIVICIGCQKSDTIFVSVKVIEHDQVNVITYFDKDIIRSKYQMRNKLREGVQYSYFKSGGIESISVFHLGNCVSPQIIFYPNGNLKSYSDMNESERKGTELSYYLSGELEQEWHFADSSETAIRQQYYRSGKLMSVVYGEMENQIYREYYESGKLKVEGRLSDGSAPIGVWKKYYENSNLMFEKKFRLNVMFSKPDGEWKYYDEKGKLLKTVIPDYTEQVEDIFKVISEDK